MRFLLGLICVVCAWPAFAGAYKNFDVAIYAAVNTTRQLADPQTLARQYERVSSQLKFDKVYLEVYRDRRFADEKSLAAIKKFFAGKGIAVSGGVTLAAGGQGGQFGTFDYEDPKDREECKRAVELAARNFDEIILDDFFFYTTKSDADIAAKGSRSWTDYRLDKMREAARNLVLAPARAANPRVKVIIKYPNWYEHFQASGYDLDEEAKLFDFIYTGTETRDPEITDQLLQQYLSYGIYRYFDNIRPNGGNRGGWVDTFSTRYIDRYAEQLWDTLFAKAPEITLFNWTPMASDQPVDPGDRAAWHDRPTSFNWDEMVRSLSDASAPGNGAPAVGTRDGAPARESATGTRDGVPARAPAAAARASAPKEKIPRAPASANGRPGWARAAGYSLEQVDVFLGKLGKPIGLAAYKPYQSSGEDYLHTYLGNIGIPIELTPNFPAAAATVLLTESAKRDADIVQKMKGNLTAGRDVVITSGLLRALQGKGIEDIVELEYTDHKVAIKSFVNGYGAGNGTSLNEPTADTPAIVFPEIRFYTNDSWSLVRGVANAKGFPILLMNRYSRGVLYVLNIPDNMGDLYRLPQPVINVMKGYLLANFPVRIDAPSHVSLFAYDNGTFIVQSFLPTPVSVNVALPDANRKLRNLVSNQRLSSPTFQIEPHSYLAFAIE